MPAINLSSSVLESEYSEGPPSPDSIILGASQNRSDFGRPVADNVSDRESYHNQLKMIWSSKQPAEIPIDQLDSNTPFPGQLDSNGEFVNHIDGVWAMTAEFQDRVIHALRRLSDKCDILKHDVDEFRGLLNSVVASLWEPPTSIIKDITTMFFESRLMCKPDLPFIEDLLLRKYRGQIQNVTKAANAVKSRVASNRNDIKGQAKEFYKHRRADWSQLEITELANQAKDKLFGRFLNNREGMALKEHGYDFEERLQLITAHAMMLVAIAANEVIAKEKQKTDDSSRTPTSRSTSRPAKVSRPESAADHTEAEVQFWSQYDLFCNRYSHLGLRDVRVVDRSRDVVKIHALALQAFKNCWVPTNPNTASVR